MKKLIAIAALGVVTVVSAPSFAKDELINNTITNSSQNQRARNTASGFNSDAILGSVKVGDSFGLTKDNTITNSSNNVDSVNSASGFNSDATLGSVSVGD